MRRLLRFLGVNEYEYGDDDAEMQKHAVVLENNRFLRKLYADFYGSYDKEQCRLPKGGINLEIGSGCGFLKQIVPDIISSDILRLPNLDFQLSAAALPFCDNSIRSIFMLNTLHHVNHPALFFKEAVRCLKPNGKIVVIEPANTLWSRFVFTRFHHECFDTAAKWNLSQPGTPLATANNALPWILFSRDCKLFKTMFPELEISSVKLHTPAAYILSGGFTLKIHAPSFMFEFVRLCENLSNVFNTKIAMFQTVVLTKRR